MSRRRKRTPPRPALVIDRKAIAAMVSVLCSVVVMTLPSDNIIWSLAIGLQGGLQGYISVKRE